MRCSIPVLAFITGIYLAQVIHRHFKYMKRIHWRQLIIAAEISLLLTVGFIPNSLDILANSLVSFVCAMQVYTFRKIEGHPYASTMCIGNIRSAMESLYTFFIQKKKVFLENRSTIFACYWLLPQAPVLAVCLLKYMEFIQSGFHVFFWLSAFVLCLLKKKLKKYKYSFNYALYYFRAFLLSK